jgi:hypothetical protein
MTPRELGLWLDDINDDVSALNRDILDRPAPRQSQALLGAWNSFRNKIPWGMVGTTPEGWDDFYEKHEGVIDQRLRFDEGAAGADAFARQLQKLWRLYVEEGGKPTKKEPKLTFDGVDPVDEVVDNIKKEARQNAFKIGVGIGGALLLYLAFSSWSPSRARSTRITYV